MISICIITKNEADKLQKCLECISRLQRSDMEIVVVDTGSTDNSKEIAQRFTSKIYDYVWCNDFSAARNFSIHKATQEYILVLDTDEYVTEFDFTLLESLIAKHPKAVGRIQRNNEYITRGEITRGTERINRLFPKAFYCYTGSIHEQVTTIDMQKFSYETYDCPIIIEHDGYLGDEQMLKDKAYRNIKLLEQELQKENNPYVLYQLGKSYYMIQKFDKACYYFEQATAFDLNPKLEYVIDMITTYGYALMNVEEYQKALLFENIYAEFGDTADFQFLMGLIYMNNAKFANAVQEFEKAAQNKTCSVEGVNSYKAYYNIGVIYECLGKIDMAIDYYSRCGGYEVAKKRVKELKSESAKSQSTAK